MNTSRPPITRIVTVFVGALLALAAAFAPGGRAHAQIDLSGMWDISFGGIISGSCSAAIFQTDGELEIFADCVIGAGTLIGSVDPAAGSFRASGSLSGLEVTIEGTAAEDGSSIEGEWSGLGFEGSFAGTRTSTEVTLIDLTGDWDIVLYADGPERCSAHFEQALTDLSVALSCESLGDGTFSGAANPLTGSFGVSGSIDGGPSMFQGSLAADGEVIQGLWIADIDRFAQGNFFGTAPGGLDAGLIAVDCSGTGPPLRDRCIHFMEADAPSFHIQFHVVLPPQDGYFGFQTRLDWTDEVISYVPQQDPQDEVLWQEQCDMVRPDVILPIPPLISGCVPFPALSEGSTATGPILQFEFQCKEEGGTTLELTPGQGGTHFLGPKGNTIHPLLLNASMNCFGSPRLPGIGDGDGGLNDSAPGEPDATPAASTTDQAATPSGEILSADGVTLPSTGAGQPRGPGLLPLALAALSGVLLLAAGSLVGARRSP